MDASRKCICEEMGHLEALVSGRALQDRMDATGISQEDLRRVMRDLDEGNHATPSSIANPVRRALRDIGTVLGSAMAGPVLLLDPSLLVVSGSLAREPVLEGMESARAGWMARGGEALQIVTASPDKQPMTGVRGAALAIFRRHVHR